MFSNVKRDDKYINLLCEFIRNEYNINAVSIIPAKRGYYGETWRLDTKDNSYFIKLVYAVSYMAMYERSLPIIQHICDHGIEFISRIIKTKSGCLSTRFDGAVLGIFEWIDGERIETDDTKIPEYQMLAKVYTVPTNGISIPYEDFSGGSADKFFAQWGILNDGRLLSLFEKNRNKLEHRAGRLKYFADICRSDNANFFITHGDAGGNLIKNGDKYFIVDWDTPILAPPERDAWVMCSRDWARDAFQNALRKNGIPYSLRSERLAYYCYHYFFYYLVSYLDGFTQTDIIQEVEDYIDGWIEDSIEYSDNVK